MAGKLLQAGSPAPPQKLSEGMVINSALGISSMRMTL
jgi:hypothetical protein